MASPTPLLAAVDALDLSALKRVLAGGKQTIPPRVMTRAANLGWLAALQALAAAGGDLNATYKNYRPLHTLIQEKPHEGGSSSPKRVACIEWMLAHGADPELLAAWPAARAIVVAAFVGDPSYVAALIEGGARIDVFAAAALGDEKRVAAALKKDGALATARDGPVGLTALQCAAGSRMGRTDPKGARGLLACARLLVEAGADVNAVTRSWAHDVAVTYFAISSGQVEILDLLLDGGADPADALPTAAWSGKDEILDRLIARGAKIDASRDGDKPILNQLVRWGQFALAQKLLDRGADPNVPDERGWTAVHQAVSRGNVKMLEALLAAGGDPHRRDAAGKTPRGMAKASWKPALLSVLGPRPGAAAGREET